MKFWTWRWRFFATLSLWALTALVTFHLALSWLDRPFPGFTLEQNMSTGALAVETWPIHKAGLPPYSRLLAVDGRAVSTPEEVLAHVRAVAPDVSVRYTFALPGGGVKEVAWTTPRFNGHDFVVMFLIWWLSALFHLVIGAWVLWMRPESAAARAHWWYCQAFAAFFLVNFEGSSTYTVPSIALYLVFSVIVPILAHLGAVFPAPLGSATARRRFLTGVWIACGLLAAAVLAGYYAPAWMALVSNGAMGAASLGLLALIGLWGWEALSKRFSARVRGQAGIIMAGLALAFVPQIGVYFVPLLTGSVFGGSHWTHLTFAAFPLAIAYAIVRTRLFDIQVVVRASVVYGAVSALLAVIYVGSATALRALEPASGANRAADLVATALVVALFVPLRDRLQAAVDRRFFREKYDVRLALEQASQSMTALLDRNQIVDRILWATDTTLVPTWVAIWLREPDGSFALYGERGDLPLRRLEPASPLVAELEDVQKPLVRPEAQTSARERPSDQLAPLGLELAIPLSFERRLLGLIALGPKRAETAYGPTDLALLATLANQSAIALENARAYQQIQAFNQDLEAKVTARTLDLERAIQDLKAAQERLVASEKMAAYGQLVAGVAHELNNPVTFIYGGVDLLALRLGELQRYADACHAGASEADLAALADEIDMTNLMPELETLLAAMKEGAERARTIVQNLRSFSRLEGYRLAPVDLGGCVASILPLVKAHFEGRVIVHLASETVPPVNGSAVHLKQVLTHLLLNAGQAVGGTGEVWVSLGAEDGRVVLSVRDTGPGVPPELQSRIFEPFFTTKPVGEGTGLGLSLCLGIVEDHGGRITVDSHPGAGATFRVILPALEREPSHA